MSVNITWCTSLACCCTAPTHCCPPDCTRCSTPPTPWHLGTPPRTRPPRCPCSWWGQLCQEATGYLPTRTRTRTHRFTFCSCNTFPGELQLWHVACMNACTWCVSSDRACPRRWWPRSGPRARRRRRSCSSGRGSCRTSPQRGRTGRSGET